MKKKTKLDINIEQNLDELLAILICPKTGSKLLFDKEKNELISEKANLAKFAFSLINSFFSLSNNNFDPVLGHINIANNSSRFCSMLMSNLVFFFIYFCIWCPKVLFVFNVF